MATAKDILVKVISSQDANRVVKAIHYSGKVVNNSTLHFGVFLDNKLEGVMSFGNSINKKGTMNLVKGTAFNNFIELNRMAFSEKLPRNSESRALGVALRMIKKHYPHIEWVISFADGTQCGDGTIYRASGFILTAITKNSSLRIDPETSKPIHVIQAHHLKKSHLFRKWDALIGWQLRYIYFLNAEAKARLSVPIIPFSKIDEMGAGMYKGKNRRVKEQELENPSNLGGAAPTHTLQNTEVVT